MLRHEVLHHEANDAIGMWLAGVLEVEPLVHLSNANGLLVGVVLQNELLQEHERALVEYTLSQLHLGCPGMRRVRLLTVVALQVLHYKLHLEALLEQSVCLHLFLYGELDFDTA